MISIYLDWNVFTEIKNGLNPKLNDILASDKYLIPYSTSHIGDIFSSYNEDNPEQKKHIDKDLEFISHFTKNNCLANDKENVRIHIYEPKELFDQRIEEGHLFRNFSLDTLTELLEGDEKTKIFSGIITDLFKNQPLEKEFIEALEHPEGLDQMNLLFPDLKNNPTMEGFLKSFGKLITRLNETEDYKKLREITQSGLSINRDKIFNSSDPFNSIKDAYSKFNIDENQIMQAQEDKNTPEWFNTITNEYLKLDIHGYQEDKVRTSKGRKETFRNTTEDAFHCAFASTCNFYITNDNRSYNKTKKLFEHLKLNTIVLKADEFIKYHDTFLFERSIDVDFEIPLKFIEIGDYTEKETDNGFIRSYHIPYFIFGFFNKMIVLINKHKEIEMITLSQLAPTNKGITYYSEIKRLTEILYKAFGKDEKNREEIKTEELGDENWEGIKWNFKKISFRFIRLIGHFQLYYDFDIKDKNK